MNLYLIRHGEVVKKYVHRYVGSTDIGLSRVGKTQAEKIRDFFKDIQIDTIYSSHRKRAFQTVRPLFLEKQLLIKKDTRIAEIDLGEWEGKTAAQVKKMIPKNIACENVTSGGELYSDFKKRVRTFLQQLKKNHKNETVVVVTHKGVIREMYKTLIDADLIVDQDYGCINLFVINGEKVKIKIQNKIIS